MLLVTEVASILINPVLEQVSYETYSIVYGMKYVIMKHMEITYGNNMEIMQKNLCRI